MGVSQKLGVPQNGWFIMENRIKMDDLGVSLFLETPTCSKACLRGWVLLPCFLCQGLQERNFHEYWSRISSFQRG